MARPVSKVIKLSDDELAQVERVLSSFNESVTAVRNATILSLAHKGTTPKAISELVDTTPKTVHNVINKYLKYGLSACWSDLQRSGRPVSISDAAKAYVIELACSKPTEHGYENELWSIEMLKDHVRMHCIAHNLPELSTASKSTVWRILNYESPQAYQDRFQLITSNERSADKLPYALMLYQEFRMEVYEAHDGSLQLCFDEHETNGLQATKQSSKADEVHQCGTLYLFTAMDLISGKITALVREHRRSFEQMELLQSISSSQEMGMCVKLFVPDTKTFAATEVRAYLDSDECYIDLLGCHKYGPWLNIVQSCCERFMRVLLISLSAHNKSDLIEKVLESIELVGAQNIVPSFRNNLDDLKV